MSKALREEAEAVTISADEFHALEQKVYRTIELLKSAREAKAAAERDSARLRDRLEELEEQHEATRGELIALRREREEVRSRVEKLLKQIDQLTAAEAGA